MFSSSESPDESLSDDADEPDEDETTGAGAAAISFTGGITGSCYRQISASTRSESKATRRTYGGWRSFVSSFERVFVCSFIYKIEVFGNLLPYLIGLPR